jgi:5-methylcytosine-specific restriction enzyme A
MRIAPIMLVGGRPRSPLWSKLRIRFIMASPFCAACGSREMLTAHHIKPFHLFPELELDPANLIVLCERKSLNCHLLFGHLMLWESFNSSVIRDAKAWKKKIAKRP